MESEAIFNAATAASFEVAPEAPQPHKWLVAAAVLLGAILTILDGSIVNVALPYMQRSFGVGVGRISWVVTSYLAAVSVMIPMSGWIAVRFGRRRYLLASVVLFVVSSALCGLAQGIGEMVVFRVIQGAAGAAMMPLSQAILLETFPVEEHPDRERQLEVATEIFSHVREMYEALATRNAAGPGSRTPDRVQA